MYVGETGRTLRVHMAEHRIPVKNRDPTNEIAMYVQETAHTYHQLAGSKDPCEGGLLGKKKGTWSPCNLNKEDQDEPKCWSDFGSLVHPLCSPKKWLIDWLIEISQCSATLHNTIELLQGQCEPLWVLSAGCADLVAHVWHAVTGPMSTGRDEQVSWSVLGGVIYYQPPCIFDFMLSP